jgi:hypothetical protein
VIDSPPPRHDERRRGSQMRAGTKNAALTWAALLAYVQLRVCLECSPTRSAALTGIGERPAVCSADEIASAAEDGPVQTAGRVVSTAADPCIESLFGSDRRPPCWSCPR